MFICVILIFVFNYTLFVQAERSGDVQTIETQSLIPPVLLPDGKEFKTWVASTVFTRNYYVNQSHSNASDDNPGTKNLPFKTINRAAQILQPGERVIVASGVYRECVRPLLGGKNPDLMISYEAAEGANVIIKGSRVLNAIWELFIKAGKSGTGKIWSCNLPIECFDDYNPFCESNIDSVQFGYMPWAIRWRGKDPYTLCRGLVFQNSKYLKQVASYTSLKKEKGTWWLEPNSLKIYLHLDADDDPNNDMFEITTQKNCFAPEQIGLGFIRVRGFKIEQVGNGFPLPQEGAISTMCGHHWIIEDNTVCWVNGIGIDIGSQGGRKIVLPEVIGYHIVRGNTVTNCGICGIAGLRPGGSLIEDNILKRNAWHDVENYFETAAIKTHFNSDVLIRKNFIIDTFHGPGIWMDFDNVNSRCTRNIVINTTTRFGGIFIEASFCQNLIDCNFIWDTRGTIKGGHGIYEHDCSNQIFAHNFVGNSEGSGFFLSGITSKNRVVRGRPVSEGSHSVINNILVNNSDTILTRGLNNVIENNLTEDMKATVDLTEKVLIWKASDRIPLCKQVYGVTHDYFNRPFISDTVCPGPFGFVPWEKDSIIQILF